MQPAFSYIYVAIPIAERAIFKTFPLITIFDNIFEKSTFLTKGTVVTIATDIILKFVLQHEIYFVDQTSKSPDKKTSLGYINLISKPIT